LANQDPPADSVALANALAGQYRIERELGRGGFATVYLAHDLRHDRPVALKVLHPEIAATLGSDRFKQEIRLAARLQHPHIVGVLDSGETAQRLWFTMPFVQGESLRHRLVRERQLPVEDAVRVTREVADALDSAHRHGVVHRDVKPENILLSEGHALVADFGIARALGAGSLTATGMSIGTPAYMSPEQASDAATVDARTDVYSLGCVLYEMLTGEAPFTGPTSQVILSRVLTETPRPLRATRPMVSPALEAVCLRAMARVPADRFATTAEFASALAVASGDTRTPLPSMDMASQAPTVAVPAARPRARRTPVVIAIAAGLVIVAAAGLAWWRGASSESQNRRLAVLPFENLGAREDDYFADGITDEVRGKLAAIPGFEVTARSSTAQYRNAGSKSPRQIGQELGVDYLLTGTVRWEARQQQARRVRVSPELVRVSDGTTRWQQPFDTDVSDVFDMQAEIASRVAKALDVALVGGARATIEEKPTTNVEAYDAFLRGEEVSQGMAVTDPPRLRRAIGYYQHAVDLDPNFLQAWAELGRAACNVTSTSSLGDDLETCRRAAERAAVLAPNRPETRLVNGIYRSVGLSDPGGALEQYRHGLESQPNNIDLLAAATTVERTLGRFDDALAHAQQAARLDPRSVVAGATLARIYHDTHRLVEADTEYARTLAMAPSNLRIVQGRAANCLSQGDLAAARAVIAAALPHVNRKELVVRFATFQEMMWVLPDDMRAEVVELQPEDFDKDRGMWALKVGATYMMMNDVAKARSYAKMSADQYAEAVRRFPDDPQRVELLGRALVLAGDSKGAIEAGERSLALRETKMDAINGPYYKYQVSRIFIQAGQYDRALELIEPLLSQPGDLTPGWLRIDPVFKPLRGNPRFDRLTAGS
jgi:eukaryotic-like serine/threonine-protein kinase